MSGILSPDEGACDTKPMERYLETNKLYEEDYYLKTEGGEFEIDPNDFMDAFADELGEGKLIPHFRIEPQDDDVQLDPSTGVLSFKPGCPRCPKEQRESASMIFILS